jgi:hypothetical protein
MECPVRGGYLPVGEKIENQTTQQKTYEQQQTDLADHPELHIPLYGEIQKFAFMGSLGIHGSAPCCAD